MAPAGALADRLRRVLAADGFFLRPLLGGALGLPSLAHGFTPSASGTSERTAEQRAEEEAVRRQHAAKPVRQRPAGAIHRQSFTADPELGGAVQSRAGKPGTDAGRGGRAEWASTRRPCPIGDG